MTGAFFFVGDTCIGGFDNSGYPDCMPTTLLLANDEQEFRNEVDRKFAERHSRRMPHQSYIREDLPWATLERVRAPLECNYVYRFADGLVCFSCCGGPWETFASWQAELVG